MSVFDTNPKTLKQTRLEISFILSIFIVYTALTYLRAPVLIREGRFWAEEATIYFKKAWDLSTVDFLFSPERGYYSLLNKITSLTALQVDLENAPQVTVAVAFAIQLLSVAVVLRSGLFVNFASRLAAVAVLTFAPASEETFLTTICGQFHLAVISMVILASPVPEGRLRRYSNAALLVFSGLTGPMAAVLAPVFLLRAWRDWDLARLMQAILLVECLVLQMLFALTEIGGGGRQIFLNLVIIGEIFAIKELVLPWFGLDVADAVASLYRQSSFGTGAWATVLPVAAASALAWCIGRSATASGRWLVLAGIILSLVSIVLTINPPLTLIAGITAERYFLAPNIALGLALIAVAADQRNRLLRRGLSMALVAVFVVFGAANYFDTHILSGASWREEVAKWRADPSHPLAVWPPGWQITLTPKQH